MRFPVDTINIKTLFNQATHRGVDFGWFGATSNQPLYSCYSGTVTEVRNNCNSTTPGSGTYGNYVKIRFDNGVYGLYAHCKYESICVSVNQKVIEHQKIAEIGNTGDSYGPHCHFEIFEGSNKVDPLKYLEVYSGQEIYSNSIKKDLTYHKEVKKAFINKMEIIPSVNSVQVNVGADVSIDWAKYSLNGANFVDLPANGIITGLTPNKSYTVACKVETTGTKEWTTSDTYTFTTKSNVTTINLKYKIGDKVVVNGTLYSKAVNGVAGKTLSNYVDTISLIYDKSDGTCQYNIGSAYLGWVKESDISLYVEPAKEPEPVTPVEPTPIVPVTPVNDTPKNSQKEDDTGTKDQNGTITPEEDKQGNDDSKNETDEVIEPIDNHDNVFIYIITEIIKLILKIFKKD